MKRLCYLCHGLGWIVIGKVLCVRCGGRQGVEYEYDDENDEESS